VLRHDKPYNRLGLTDLVLNEKLDTLNRSRGGLGDGGSNTAHLTTVRLPLAIFAKSDHNGLYADGYVMAEPIEFVTYS
jgi:hypothetical protein